jgi:hypothetical protein
MAADYIGIKMEQSIAIRKLISERTGVPSDHILLAALHQHTSPCLADPTKKETALRDKVFLDVVYRRFADAAVMALDDRAEASISVGARDVAEPIAFVRRYFTKEAGVVTNPSSKFTLTGRCADADNTVRLVRFARKDKNDIAILNFSTHPDVIGGTKWSADWPGFARRYVEADLKGVSCLLLVGVQGDSNHFNFFADQLGKGYAYSAHMGRVIADTVVKLWDKTEKKNACAVSGAIDVVYNKTRTDGEEDYAAACELLRKNRENDYAEGEKKPHITELGRATRIVNLRKDAPIYRRVPVTVLKLGDIAIVGFGGEPFTHYASAVRKACPDTTVLTGCCSNGYEGYLPTKQAFAEGGYEASSSAFSPNLEEDCVAAAVKMIKSFGK